MIIKKITLKSKEEGAKTYSLVRNPAVQVKGVLMSESKVLEEVVIKAKVFSEEKKQVIAPLIIPNKMIRRSAKEIAEEENGYVYWDEESILEEQKSLMLSLQEGTKLKLDHESETSDAFLLECWVIRNPATDIACEYFGENSLPKGTLMTVTQITNDGLWEEVKSGLSGISLEGSYTLVTVEDNESDIVDGIVEGFSEFFNIK